MTELTPTLPKDLNTLAGLDALEEQVVRASLEIGDAQSRFAYYLHTILEHRLWRHRKIGEPPPEGEKDTRDQAYMDQREYLEDLKDRCMRGVSTMKLYHSTMRMAQQIGFTPEKVLEMGLSIFLDLRDRVDVNRATGEPLGLKSGGQLPGGTDLKSHLQNVVNQVSEVAETNGGLMKYDRKRVVDQFLGAKVPRVEFDIPDINNPQYITWHVEMWDENSMLVEIPGNHGPTGPDMPDYVKKALFKRLGVQWKGE